MPYALKHNETTELLACTLVNIYDFRYHGVKLWEEREAAEKEYASFLAGLGVQDPWAWSVTELDEHQAKMCNVKLNNNSGKHVFLGEDGRITARSAE